SARSVLQIESVSSSFALLLRAKNHSSANFNLAARSALRRTGSVLGPTPCNARRSRSLHFESLLSVVIFSRSSARLAGAPRSDKNPSAGLRFASQIGHDGQSVLLKYVWPASHFLAVLRVAIMPVTKDYVEKNCTSPLWLCKYTGWLLR